MEILNLEILNQFKLYLFENEKSENTINKYIRDIVHFINWIGERKLIKSVVIEYKKELAETYAPASVNSMLSSLNSFFEYTDNPQLKIKLLKIQRRIFSDKEKELSKADYRALIIAADKMNDKRLYYLLQTMGSTGIRVSEVRFVTYEAVNAGKAIINCKGKLRQVYFPAKLCHLLKAYIKANKIKTGPVFVTKSGQPLDRSNIWKMMKKLSSVAGVSAEKIFPHNLRHLFARSFYAMQKDIVRLADILGHSSINTTRIYTIEGGDTHLKQLQKLGLLLC